MKGLILLADGFEDSEAIVTRDILIRGKIDILTSSIKAEKEVLSSHNLKVITDLSFDEINYEDYDFLILPGGLKGVNNLSSSNSVLDLIKIFIKSNKDVHAICAAPSILGKLGLLDDKKFTCYPGFESNMKGSYTSEGTTQSSEHIITGKAMFYSTDFGLEILKKYVSKEIYNHVFNSIRGK